MKDKKNYYPKSQVKYPRGIAQAEIFNQHSLSPENKQKLLYENKIERLTNESFNLNGAYPYLIDFINYLCTHHRDLIERQDNPGETHYRVRIPKKEFNEIILGEYKDQKNHLEQEIYRLLSDKDESGERMKPKILPLNMEYAIRTKPIRLDIVYNDGEKLKPEQMTLKNVTGESVKGYIIEFFKPLWQSVLKDDKGQAWFPFPVRFHAKMIDFIKKHKNDGEFKKYGNFGGASNYRKLYLYLNLHDNSKAMEINYDAIDLTLKSLPSNIKKNDKGEYDIHNWFTSHQFFQKGLRLFYRMGEAGLLDGVKLIPTSVWYDKPLKELKVKINRGNVLLPEFINNVSEPSNR
ncbi:MAG: hypothetical protein ABSG94_12115 [Brevinematales bacterium]